STHYGVQHARSADLALKRGAVQSRRMICSPEFVQHLDDAVASKVRRIRHRRAPIAVLPYDCLFVQQLGMLQHDLTNGLNIVAPDSVGESTSKYQPRPTRGFVAARQRQLGVGEFSAGGIDSLRVIVPKFLNRNGISASELAQQIFGLVS